MTKYFISFLFLTISFFQTQGQFFVQQLSQDQILNAEQSIIVTNQGDTLTGRISSATLSDTLLTRFTFKTDSEKIKFAIEEIKSLAVIPNEDANWEDTALLPILKEIGNDDFIEALPEGGWVYYERIQLPGKRERYQLSQRLNPGFDSKIKIYVHPEANDNGSSSLNGLTLGGLRDDRHFVSIDGQRPITVNSLSYRKKSLGMLYGNCSDLQGIKLKWKDFAKHVFTYDQKCD